MQAVNRHLDRAADKRSPVPCSLTIGAAISAHHRFSVGTLAVSPINHDFVTNISSKRSTYRESGYLKKGYLKKPSRLSEKKSYPTRVGI